MATVPMVKRPSFAAALSAWKSVLAKSGLPVDMIWLFDENLCFERNPDNPEELKLGFQTRFTPPPADAAQIAYEHFSEFKVRLVFYRIGTAGGKSVCLLLCDEWFEHMGEREGYIHRDDWLISFRPGPAAAIEEITDEQRWKERVVRNRPLHDLDFCMPLQAVHETLAHGRMLTAYEHYSLKFLDAWRRLHSRLD
jgi:hypothetical protein